jgi:hypothetical protein
LKIGIGHGKAPWTRRAQNLGFTTYSNVILIVQSPPSKYSPPVARVLSRMWTNEAAQLTPATGGSPRVDLYCSSLAGMRGSYKKIVPRRAA